MWDTKPVAHQEDVPQSGTDTLKTCFYADERAVASSRTLYALGGPAAVGRLARLGTIPGMDSDFEAWVESLHLDEPDEGGDVGTLSPGTLDFFREIFDASGGPVSTSILDAAWKQRALELAVHAVALITADLRRTTQLDPDIEVRSLDDDVIAVTYNADYQAPGLFAIRDPEATCEVADNLRDHIVEDLWSPWPTCAVHGSVLNPQPGDGEAVWFCRAGTPHRRHDRRTPATLTAPPLLPRDHADDSAQPPLHFACERG